MFDKISVLYSLSQPRRFSMEKLLYIDVFYSLRKERFIIVAFNYYVHLNDFYWVIGRLGRAKTL